jgi:hypothetical protein
MREFACPVCHGKPGIPLRKTSFKTKQGLVNHIIFKAAMCRLHKDWIKSNAKEQTPKAVMEALD